MNRPRWAGLVLRILTIGISLGACSRFTAFAAAPHRSEGDRPNIIVILVDDMGYSDLGCTGSEIETPNLDRLAGEGVLFTNFYNTSRCCPSRASLLTGQYQWDAGIGHMDTTRSAYPEYQGHLNAKSATIAEVLGDHGYQTFMSGKWHVGSTDRGMWPDKRGFEQFYGVPAGGGIYFYPSIYWERPVFWNGEEIFPDESWYSTDAFTDYAIDYIEKRRSKDSPFFMYIAYVAPHFPLMAKKADIDKYRARYASGYHAIREERIRKQKELGLIAEDIDASDPVYPDWGTVENQEQEALEMAVYAAMIDCLDQNIGRLMRSLEKQGIAENTAVFFLSDNGACQTDYNKTPDILTGGRESNAAYGIWNNVSNTPYRLRKSQCHEGGIITPLIVHWPKGLNIEGNRIRETGHINDLMPTCLDMAGVAYPDRRNGIPLDPLDGMSLLPLLNGEGREAEPVYHWEHEGNRAIRKGNWKLVALHESDWELYDLETDPYETRNRIHDQPELAESLMSEYNQWADDHGVRPWPLER